LGDELIKAQRSAIGGSMLLSWLKTFGLVVIPGPVVLIINRKLKSG
jgi:hypothetical protein